MNYNISYNLVIGVILKSAKICSQNNLPHLALYLMKDESGSGNIGYVYVEKMTLALLQASVKDILFDKTSDLCEGRRKQILDFCNDLERAFKVDRTQMKNAIVEQFK